MSEERGAFNAKDKFVKQERHDKKSVGLLKMIIFLDQNRSARITFLWTGGSIFYVVL